MKVIQKSTCLPTELLAELQEAADKLAHGDRDPETAKRAALRMDRMREENLASPHRKTEAPLCAGQPHQQVITGIVPDRNNGIEPLPPQSSDEIREFRPIPFPEPIFVPVSGPRGVVDFETEFRKGWYKQRSCMLFSDKGDVPGLHGFAEQGRGEG